MNRYPIEGQPVLSTFKNSASVLSSQRRVSMRASRERDHSAAYLTRTDRRIVSPPLAEVKRWIASILDSYRPVALRNFDQIPMQSPDLIEQALRVAPQLADKTVAFVGDYDGTSVVLGLLSKVGVAPPRQMMLLDFDERILESYDRLARQHEFRDLLDVRRYNVFDPVPNDLLGKFDWFYTNPPYGSHNNGASGRLFVTRGCELVDDQRAYGCIILPDDSLRTWSESAMLDTQHFLCDHGWLIREKHQAVHGYHLDDDPDLRSSFMIVARAFAVNGRLPRMPWAGRRVPHEEIPLFYGRNVDPPYPSFVVANDYSPTIDATQANAA